MNTVTNSLLNNNKKIIYLVNPPCISENREIQYIAEAKRLYESNNLPANLTVDEKEDRVIVTYNR